MSFVACEFSDKAVKVINGEKLTSDELYRLCAKYGRIERIISEEQSRIVCFSSQEEAEKCVADSDNLQSLLREIKLDVESVGDVVNYEQASGVGKIRKVLKSLTERNSTFSPAFAQSTSNSDPYMPDCSSPVLLNTVEPGFRLAYCHNLINLKTNDPKTGKLNQFNQSIKKYMDNAPRIGSQEFVLTNLPPNFTTEDVYKLCGKIEPAAVELKTTSNINILYANVKAKSKEDFEKLTELLGNRLINGTKITTIPITKMARPDSKPSQ